MKRPNRSNRQNRMNVLANAGVNTGKYFNLELPEGLSPGATIQVTINENGKPVVLQNNTEPDKKYEFDNTDAILAKIYDNGYVKNTTLHRRWVMAQYFKMMNYYGLEGESWYAALRCKGYMYQFSMMLEEVRVLSKMEKTGDSSFRERYCFFTPAVIKNIYASYVSDVRKHIDSLPIRHCKGIEYVRIPKQGDVFVEDITKKIINPMLKAISGFSDVSYAGLYYQMVAFRRNHMIELPYDTKQIKLWVDRYQAEGAFYTLDNLIKWHGVKVNAFVEHPSNGLKMLSRDASLAYIRKFLASYKGYQYHALLKATIEDNDFNFKETMKRIEEENYMKQLTR